MHPNAKVLWICYLKYWNVTSFKSLEQYNYVMMEIVRIYWFTWEEGYILLLEWAMFRSIFIYIKTDIKLHAAAEWCPQKASGCGKFYLFFRKLKLDLRSFFILLLWIFYLIINFLMQIRNLMEPVQSEPDSTAKQMVRQGSINQVGPNHMVRPSSSSEQLVSQSAVPQMLQQNTRFW